MEDPWIDCELAGCRLGDERLDKRLRLLVERMDGAMGESIPLVCQRRSKNPPLGRRKNTPRAAGELVHVVHGRAPRAGRRAPQPG